MVAKKPGKKSNGKKKSALAEAATRKLAKIGGGGGDKMDPEQLAHAIMHAEADGEIERVSLDDGSWGWGTRDETGKVVRVLKPTPEILAALAKFEREGHPAH